MWRSKFGGLALSTGGAVMLAFGPTAFADYALYAALMGILLIVGGVILAWPSLSRLMAGEAEATIGGVMGDKYNIAGSNFGHIGPVNNFGPQRLTFNPETAAQLLESLPEKKAIDLRTVGSDSAHKVGAEYQSFLIEKGYKVQRSITGILSPPPDKKITVADVGGHYIVTIAPDA